MDVGIEKLRELNELVSLSRKKKLILVLNPEDKQLEGEEENENVMYDKLNWSIPEEFKNYINELAKDYNLSYEEKIMKIYERVCMDFIYDDNLISYIKKVDDDKFTLPDWYGLDIDEQWQKNRNNHNRRICYELSRYLAKSLNELLKDNNNFKTCIIWDKDLTHYFVGLTCNDYSITLDPDDFFNIKDLTRIKSGLTAEGIVLVNDKYNKFRSALDKFNEGREKYSTKKIEQDIKDEESKENEETEVENDEVLFLRKVVEILDKKYGMDSQGIFEYVKEIVDINLGAEKRVKIWKKLEGDTRESQRHIRCLIVKIKDEKYLIDVDEKVVRLFDEKEFEQKRAIYIPYKEGTREGHEYYDGT